MWQGQARATGDGQGRQETGGEGNGLQARATGKGASEGDGRRARANGRGQVFEKVQKNDDENFNDYNQNHKKVPI